MTARITTDIFCDQCGDWAHGTTSDRPRVRAARKVVRRLGWTTTRSPDDTGARRTCDVCPSCKAAAREEEPEQQTTPLCVYCKEPVEPERVCYANPTCYACLPPPDPLPECDPARGSKK